MARIKTLWHQSLNLVTAIPLTVGYRARHTAHGYGPAVQIAVRIEVFEGFYPDSKL